jgi:hypothetical protein
MLLMKYSTFRKYLSFQTQSQFRIVGFTNVKRIGMRFKLQILKHWNSKYFANQDYHLFQFQQYKKLYPNTQNRIKRIRIEELA